MYPSRALLRSGGKSENWAVLANYSAGCPVKPYNRPGDISHHSTQSAGVTSTATLKTATLRTATLRMATLKVDQQFPNSALI
jgi:hypothetical protein